MTKVLLASITLAVASTGSATAEPVTRSATAKPVTRSVTVEPVTRIHARVYQRAYRAVVQALGRRAPGRNIIRDGIIRDGTSRGAAPSDAEVTRSIRVLDRMRATSGPALSLGTPGTATTTGAVASASTSPSLPSCTWEPESGGNPAALNPQSGAGGYYQILPSTWAAYGGTGAPQDAPMSEQTRVAQRIWDSQGSSAWVNC